MKGAAPRACRSAVFAIATLFAFPSAMSAHLVSTGMGPVYDGIGHLFLTPEDLVPVVILAMYAGLRGTAAGRRSMFVVPVAWFAGGLAGSLFPAEISFPLPALSFLILGGFVAADLFLPTPAVAVVGAVFGLLHGYLNGVALRSGSGLAGLAGITAMLFVVLTLASALVVSIRRPPLRIAVRVAGSWAAAIGLLMIGWALR